MSEVVDAIYEDGVLRLAHPLEGVNEHTQVRVTVEVPKRQPHALRDCIGILPDEDAAEMRQIIEAEFERVNPSEW
jgi:predicted DNA-binding antitoxin AbrB/MazE fold protein